MLDAANPIIVTPAEPISYDKLRITQFGMNWVHPENPVIVSVTIVKSHYEEATDKWTDAPDNIPGTIARGDLLIPDLYAEAGARAANGDTGLDMAIQAIMLEIKKVAEEKGTI